MEQVLVTENVTDRTDQRGSLVPGKEKVLALIYSQFTQTSIRLVTTSSPFKYPLRAHVQHEKPKEKGNFQDSSYYIVGVTHGL